MPRPPAGAAGPAGFEVTALSTSSPESAARAGEIHGVARTFGTATDLAACDEVDLVVVSVRVPAHRESVSAAVQAGKAVFCEWPLGNGLAETEELARLVGKHDVPSIVGLQIRANPVMNYLRDLVADGYVGEVLSATVIGSAGGTWGAYSDPNSRYLLDPANGATLLTVPFSHALDGLAWVLGEPERLRMEHAPTDLRLRTSTVKAHLGLRTSTSNSSKTSARAATVFRTSRTPSCGTEVLTMLPACPNGSCGQSVPRARAYRAYRSRVCGHDLSRCSPNRSDTKCARTIPISAQRRLSEKQTPDQHVQHTTRNWRIN